MSTSRMVLRWQPWLASSEPSTPSATARLWLDAEGCIRDVGDGTGSMLGYERQDLIAHHVSDVLPALAGSAMTAATQVTPRLALFSECGVRLKARHADGGEIPCRLRVERHDAEDEPGVRLDLERVDTPVAKGFGPARSPFPRSPQ